MLKVTVTEAPGAIVPREIPLAGFAPGTGVPSTTTLPGTKEEPAGIGSLSTTLLTGAIPLLATTIV
ncbi:hypothetical protein D3C75_1275890 [compost metagenome]